MQDIGEGRGKAHGDAGNPFQQPKFCLRCQEPLLVYEVEEPRCSRCGLQFNPADHATYRLARVPVYWKFWLPGFALAVASGVISYAALLVSGSELGLALFFAVPISVGAILGYGTRVRIWLVGMLAITAVASIVFVLISMNVAGVFCGLTLGIIFLMPTAVGIVFGFILRLILTNTRWDQRFLFPLALMVLFPYAAQIAENCLPRRTEVATVRTELSLHSTRREAWNAIMFYEEVEHDPPWLLKLALPKAVRSEGNKRRAGEVVRCYYDRGYLAKRITRVEPERLLAFNVVEQHLHFERDITLTGGSFRIDCGTNGQTRIILTTWYERQLSPAWLWEPIEREVVHSLHEHVLEGIRLQAEKPVRPHSTPDSCWEQFRFHSDRSRS